MSHTNPVRYDDRTTHSLLQLAVVRDQRAIDRLLDLLATPPDAARDLFGSLLECEDWPSHLSAPRDLAARSPGLEDLVAIKEKGKAMVVSGVGELQRLRGTAFYTLGVAVALAHHAERISSAGDDELRDLMLDLAELTAAPWSGLFETAASRCTLGD